MLESIILSIKLKNNLNKVFHFIFTLKLSYFFIKSNLNKIKILANNHWLSPTVALIN